MLRQSGASLCTMSLRDQIINAIIDREGGYVNDPADSGGETKFGITETTARGYGYSGSMPDMSRQVAYEIYADKYWASLNADSLLLQHNKIAEEVVDTGVNMGPVRAARFLQRALNIFNQRGKLYDDIVTDGNIGPATLNALRHYLKKRDSAVLISALNCLQGAAYIELAERREKDEKFIYGWLRNRVGEL